VGFRCFVVRANLRFINWCSGPGVLTACTCWLNRNIYYLLLRVSVLGFCDTLKGHTKKGGERLRPATVMPGPVTVGYYSKWVPCESDLGYRMT